MVGVIKTILKEVGIPDATIVKEARGLRATDRSRPGDVVALDFFVDGRHLVIDAVMTTMYRDTVLEKVATFPGYATKQAEDRKFVADKTSRRPISTVHGGPHILVPFAIEDGDRLGSYAHALLRRAAEYGISCPLLYEGNLGRAKVKIREWVKRGNWSTGGKSGTCGLITFK